MNMENQEPTTNAAQTSSLSRRAALRGLATTAATAAAMGAASSAPAAHTIADVQEQAVRDLEIKSEVFTPPDQIRKWVREWPKDLKVDPAMLMGGPPAKP